LGETIREKRGRKKLEGSKKEAERMRLDYKREEGAKEPEESSK